MIYNLPKEIQKKIILYLSHPINDILRKIFNDIKIESDKYRYVSQYEYIYAKNYEKSIFYNDISDYLNYSIEEKLRCYYCNKMKKEKETVNILPYAKYDNKHYDLENILYICCKDCH